MATNGETENIIFTGDWQKVSAAGNVAHEAADSAYQWAIKPDGWAAPDDFIGAHGTMRASIPALLSAGQVLWVKGAKGRILIVTADAYAAGV